MQNFISYIRLSSFFIHFILGISFFNKKISNKFEINNYRISNILTNSLSENIYTKQNVLVIGGTGRVGGSTVLSLLKGYTGKFNLTVAGRTNEAWLDFKNRLNFKLSNNLQDLNFINLDINSKDQLLKILPNYDIIIHTAGPFQQIRNPIVLETSLLLGKKYVDVCDDIELSRICRSDKYQSIAKESGASAVISAGIWPGASSLLAQEIITIGGGHQNVENVKFYFHTSGSGGAGPTILTATFLLIGEDVLVYKNGEKQYFDAASDLKIIDFGKDLGVREVVRLNLIETESCFVSGAPK